MKSRLYEISLIRVILIISILIGHSFAPFSGREWGGVNYEMDTYSWINPFFVSLQLPCFVFISGYLSALSKNKKSLYNIIKTKFKRLFIPSVFFSLIYYYAFYDHSAPAIDIIMRILQGCGHLWFLPMLFWCFVLIAIIDKIKVKELYLIIILAILSLLPLSIPFGIGNAFQYLIYFYFGRYVIRHNNVFSNLKSKQIYFLWLIYLFFTICIKILAGDYIISYKDTYGLYSKMLVVGFLNFQTLVIGLSGSLALYSTITKYTRAKLIKYNNHIENFASVSYGVYIYHQFILIYLYHNVDTFNFIPIYIIPILFFFISLIISTYMTKISLKTKIGTFLIG